jgi:hypothetical protein
MKWNRVRVFSILLITGLVCANVQAASTFDLGLPPDSNWYVHVNLELVRNSEVGREFVLEKMDEVMDDIQQKLGVDVRNEVDGLTLFGETIPSKGNPVNDGAIIFHGSISGEARTALLSSLREKGAEVSSFSYQDVTWYTVKKDSSSLNVTDENSEQRENSLDFEKTVYFSFGNLQTLVTHDWETMRSFLDTGGHYPGLESIGSDTLLVSQVDGSLLKSGANTMAGIETDWDSSLLKDLDMFGLKIAEYQDGVQVETELTASSPEVAMSVRNILEGLVLLKALSDSDGVKGDILRQVQFENDDRVLHVDVPVTAEQISALDML